LKEAQQWKGSTKWASS